MKSYKCKGSFLIDSMAGFLLIGLITLLLIPMMNQMQASINHKLQTIDASKVILTTVSKINKEEFQKIPLLIKRHVYSINVKAFSLIEMLVAMMVISITLLIVPDLIRLSKTFLIESRELTTVDFEFFSRDILEDFKGVDRNDIEIRQQRIILHKGEEMIEYKLINNKIIKVVNDRGNITLINNVTAFTANIYYKSIIKITITVKVGTNLQTKTIYV